MRKEKECSDYAIAFDIPFKVSVLFCSQITLIYWQVEMLDKLFL